MKFDNVQGAYARIFDGKNELCRFNLSDNKDGISNGNIVGYFERTSNHWSFKALGYYTKLTSMGRDCHPFICEVMENNFTNINLSNDK